MVNCELPIVNQAAHGVEAVRPDDSSLLLLD